MSIISTVDGYINRLKIFDWTGSQTADDAKWRKFHQELNDLREVAKRLDPAGKIWHEYAPRGFSHK